MQTSILPGERAISRVIGPDFEWVGDLKVQNSNVIRFDGHEYVFSHRAILTLVTTSTCNAACKFCSNEITFTPSGPYLTPDDRLRRTVAFAKLAGVSKVAYTGGEPTANATKLYELVSAVSPHFARSRLHTNGFGLRSTVPTPTGPALLLPALIDAGLTGTSISVAHHDEDVNRKVMRIKGRWPGMSADDLRFVAEHAGPSYTPRLSCVLTPEGVWDFAGIKAYLDWGYELGFRRFIFRSCSQIPEQFRKTTEFSTYNEDGYIPIEPLIAEFAADPSFEQTYAQHKSDSHVHVYRWRDASVDIDESSEEEDPDRKIRRLNVMPDGITYTSWIDPFSWLFPDEEELARNSARRELPLLADDSRR